MISSELPELIGMSDRISSCTRALAGELPAGSVSRRSCSSPPAIRGRGGMSVADPLNSGARAAGASAGPRRGLAGRHPGVSRGARLRRAARRLRARLDHRHDPRRRLPDRPNIVNMLQRSVALGIVAAGRRSSILLGSLDLSVAQVISLSALLGATTMDGSTANIVPAIALVLGVGAVVGLANGVIITKLRVNAFIATLGVALIIKGVIDSRWDGPRGSVPDSFESFGYTRFGVIPVSVFLLAVGGRRVYCLLRFTRFGYRIYAVGGDEDVSQAVGPAHAPHDHRARTSCARCSRRHRLFLASRLGAGTPTVGPEGGYDLESIAAVVLGGTR
jgi:ribose/xylose/arabinose/galactoside ABC-type transport system permease subunit